MAGEGRPWDNRTLVQMTPAESARWLQGQDTWLSHITDRQVWEQINRQNKALRKAFYDAADRFAMALHRDSQQTEQRLLKLKADAEAGDQQALALLVTMMGALITNAFVDLGEPPAA